MRAVEEDVSFEIVGTVPLPWVSDLEDIAARLVDHPWGGVSLELVLWGDLPELLGEYMPAQRFSEWKAGYDSGRIALTGAISFVAVDGRRAAAVLPVDDRAMFLMLVGHEMVEAALERRHDAEGHQFVEQTHTSLSHVLWTEYTAERTRRQVFDELELGYSDLDNGYLTEQICDVEKELPGLIQWAVANNAVPQRIVQHWYELARNYAMSLGRADQGSPGDLADLASFRDHALLLESAEGWDALTAALRRVYEQPDARADDLDTLVRDEGWLPLYEEGLGEVWNSRYAAAGGT